MPPPTITQSNKMATRVEIDKKKTIGPKKLLVQIYVHLTEMFLIMLSTQMYK